MSNIESQDVIHYTQKISKNETNPAKTIKPISKSKKPKPNTEEAAKQNQEKKQEKRQIRQFKKTMRTYLLTSRFNTETRAQNEIYRNIKWPNGCIYCSPEHVSHDIPIESKMIVLEMDNDKNTIFGVGMLLNKPFHNKHSVYADENYNRYSYIGKYRIKREELNEQQEAVFKALDILCFKGNEHMKRGHGLKSFPAKLLMNCSSIIDLPKFIEQMFKTRFFSK
jgi:hypothetical protein